MNAHPNFWLTTQDAFADADIVQTLGLVRGNTIRSRHLGKDIIASLRMLAGGEVTEYTKMVAEAREQATDRMLAAAHVLGANAVVGVRYTTSTIMDSAEILVFGTAVRIQPKMV
jgi:uncharacterized protein YbjQ (UPF0145 family)